MDKVYLVYKKTIEDQEKLIKFIQVMGKAGFPEESVVPIDMEDFHSKLEKENPPHFALCINNTYTLTSSIYCDSLKANIYDFFSKDYADFDKRIFLMGLMVNVENVFQVQYKMYAWKTLLTFYEYYKNHAVKDDAEVTEKEVESVDLITEVKEAVEVISDTGDVVETPKDNVDLISFYKNVKQLFSQFEIVQNQIKQIEFQMNGDK